MPVSLIIPVFNAEATLGELFARIGNVGRQSGLEFEIVAIDDASRDGSLAILRTIAAGPANVAVIANRVNCGQSAATRAGTAACRSDIVVTLDDDLKHRPEDIPRMLDLLERAGPDALVMGIFRGERRALWRIVTSIGANAVSNLFLVKPLPLQSSTFCAFRKRLCGDLERGGNGKRSFIVGLVQAAATIVTLPVFPGRDGSVTRYTLAALFRLFLNRSSCYRPGRVAIGLALCWLATLAVGGFWLQAESYASWLLGAAWLVCAAATWLLSVIAARMWTFGMDPTRRDQSDRYSR